MAKKDSTSEESQLREALSAWATKYRVEENPYVQELLRVLETGEGVEALANLPVYELLPRAVNKGNERNLNLSNTLAIIRNVLVFFPVALTWIAVSKSTTAFAAYTEANKSAVVNFLEFWQNGYDVLAPEWTIGHVAMLDFSIIMIVIVLTLITAFMNKGRINSQKRERAVAERERLALIITINKYMVAHSKMDAPAISSTIASSIRTLRASAGDLSKAARAFDKDFSTARQILNEIKRIKGKN
jgi:hypothetical protein